MAKNLQFSVQNYGLHRYGKPKNFHWKSKFFKFFKFQVSSLSETRKVSRMNVFLVQYRWLPVLIFCINILADFSFNLHYLQKSCGTSSFQFLKINIWRFLFLQRIRRDTFFFWRERLAFSSDYNPTRKTFTTELHILFYNMLAEAKRCWAKWDSVSIQHYLCIT